MQFMKKTDNNHGSPKWIPIVLSVIGISILTLNSCSTALQRADSLQSSFNNHAEGWLNMVGLITILSGWFTAGFNWLRNRFKFRVRSDKDVEKKRPVLPFLTIRGKSIFRELTWQQAFTKADEIAKKMLDDKNKETYYLPTLIVGIGRGGASFGSLISYRLGELPILALDRYYGYDNDNRRETKDMYPFRIPKVFLEKVLLVAGESHTRETLKVFKEKLFRMGAGQIRTCVFYNQQLLEEKTAVDFKIDYYGIGKRKDYLMPWQTEQSLHPSEKKEDAENQNARIGHLIADGNRFDSEESGFYCMRHAETEANEKDEFIGSRTDIPLTEKGREQARKVGEYFKSIGVTFDTIYHSPMTRCYQTAREINLIVGGKMVAHDGLIELDYGDWEGLSRQEIESRYAEDYIQYCTGMLSRPTGSGESANDVSVRVLKFLNELKSSHATMGKSVLVVTHKTAGRILLQITGHNQEGHFRGIPLDNAAIGYVSIRDDKASVVLDNKQC